MNDLTLPLQGVFTALITPFNTDGTVDYHALQALVEWQISQGIQGLVPVGTTGESPTLNHEEHLKVIQTVVEQTNNRVPVIAGTGANSTAEAIELTSKAREIGVQASLQVCPYYNKPNQEGIYQHFIAIAESSTLPIIVYNIPGRTSVAIELSTLIKLAQHKLVIGIKEATGHIKNTIDLVHANTETSILSGDDNIALSIIAQGGHGLISVASNIIPAEMSSLISLSLQGEFQEARTLYYKYLPLFKALFSDTNPIPVKYLASKMKLCQEIYRLPLCATSDEIKTILDNIYTQYSFSPIIPT